MQDWSFALVLMCTMSCGYGKMGDICALATHNVKIQIGFFLPHILPERNTEIKTKKLSLLLAALLNVRIRFLCAFE